MLKDLMHNSIIKQTVTDRFIECVDAELIPLLEERYADTLLGIQMYEDYISDRFIYEDEYYYPLTVLIEGDAPFTLWITWPCVKGGFIDENPYAYTLDEPIGFEIAGGVPSEFTEKLLNRAIYADTSEMIPLTVSTTARPITLLSGKYSQTFVDELSRQITKEIERTLGVCSVAGSGLRLELVFSPETYMEHTSEKVTYRRLLLTDGTRAVRDFWVRWERTDIGVPTSVCDHVNAANCRFTLGEDASQKIREREYRFLIRENADKYRFAMGKRNVTEWRDLIKKMIKRGQLTRVTMPTEEPMAYTEAVSASAPVYTEPTPASQTPEDELMAQLSEIVGRPQAVEEDTSFEPEYDEEYERALRFAREQVAMANSGADEELRRREEALAKERERMEEENRAREAELQRAIGTQVKRELDLRERERMEVEARRAVIENAQREQLNERTEQERRRADAAEAELRELRSALLRLDEERERLAELRRLAEEETERLSEMRRQAEEEEARRKEEYRLAEEARALEELRLEAERLAEQERLREEEEARRLEEEALRRLEEERLEQERIEREKLAREEEERRRIEIEVRLEYERRRREEEARAEAQRRLEEERARLEAQKRLEEERRREEAARIEAEHRAEVERLVAEHRRAQEAAKLEEERHRQEAARLEEARRHAEEYKRRAEEEARREFERHKQEAARLAEERERAEQAHRDEELRREALERQEALAREERERAHEAELRRLAEEARAEEERLREAARAEAERTRDAVSASVTEPKRGYTYTAKMVHLIFRGAVDPNVIGRIQALMNQTIDYFDKSAVPISVRAMITDTKTVDLDFVRIPEEEMPLLINIIKVLGNSDLGIAKIVLD